MQVLVVNCGSSTIKAAVVDVNTGAHVASSRVERIVDGGHAAALKAELPALLDGNDVRAVGHRVVHGGERFGAPVRIDDDVEAGIEALIPLAPIHNPANLAGIRAARALLPDVPHVAVFDTAFHATLPRRARTYALPTELADKHGIRRYGFHGPSHGYVANKAAAFLGEDARDLRIITCHLGNGCSMAAVEYGRSVETTMGMTPLEGLVMGTRSGDLDPGVLIALQRLEGLDADALDQILNKQSGLAGLSGVGNDLRDIEARAADGDERCQLAIHVFCHRVRKYIGAYAAVMGGVDAIVFTGGIGQNSALIRHRVAQRLDFLGARLDEDANRKRLPEGGVLDLSEARGRVRLLAVATDEEHAIASETAKLVGNADVVEPDDEIPVAISARHVHLTEEAVHALFGPGTKLLPRRELTQPGQFAAEQRVTLVGPKRRIENVTIVGPERSRCQVEVARTDEFFLGVDAPIRCSGDLDNTPGITLEGPAGQYTMQDGVICAQRHIHMTTADAERFGVKHKDVVEVALDSDGRDLVFGDVVVRVKDSYHLEMHVDTDEGNAAEIERDDGAVIVVTSKVAHIRRRDTRFA